MDLYTYIYNNVPVGWEELFKSSQAEIQQISDILEEEKKTYQIVPEQENIFRVFNMCKPQDLTVVITGADPYFQMRPNGKPRALGFSFSVDKDDTIPSSLHNIYKEIKNNYPNSEIPKHGDISHWVPQGVFLLNASLTCRLGEPGSHVNKYKLWTPFINKFVKFMATINKNLIWVLWGKDSQKFEELIDKSFNNIYMSAHPSGLSATRGFFGCQHFKKINEQLLSLGRTPIIWLEQISPYKDKIDTILSMISDNELTSLIDFYKENNYMKMENKYFTIQSYIENLSAHNNQDINKVFIDFTTLYSKYSSLQNTINCLAEYYKEDKIANIMYKIDKNDLNKLIEFYGPYYKSEYKLSLPDFSLRMYLKSLQENKYKDKPMEDFLSEIISKKEFSLEI